MFPRALTLGRIQGIPVRVDPTLLLIGLLIVWTFAGRFDTASRSLLSAIVMAASATLLFFASILAHELGHALEARHRDMEVHGITLFLFGGVTEMRMHASRPRDEFVIAAVGPWVSLVTAATFGLAATAAGEFDGALADAVAEVTGLMGWLNLTLAIFNLVPGSPLDGGRVLRAILWGVLGDRGRASRWAARAGQAVAALIMGLGVLAFLQGADLIGGLWLVFIGSFIWNGARAELGAEQVRGMLEGRTARELGSRPVPRVDEDRTLVFVEIDLEGAGTDVALVTVDDVPVALLLAGDLEEVDPFDRDIRTARDIARPLEEVPSVELDEPLDEVLALAQDHPAVVVQHDGQVLSAVTLRTMGELLRQPASNSHLPPPPPPPPPPPAPADTSS